MLVVSTSPVEAFVSAAKKFTAIILGPLGVTEAVTVTLVPRGNREPGCGAVRVMPGGSKTEKVTVGEVFVLLMSSVATALTEYEPATAFGRVIV